MSASGRFEVATMSAAEVAFAIDLAADEGWNPGLHDAATFHAADPDGFLVGRLDGVPIGCISAVSYPGRFGFIGLYIVVPRERGKGYGIALWRAAMARLAGHNVGLDGVVAQQANYRKSGFALAYSNLRFERSGPAGAADRASLVPIGNLPFASLEAYDRAHFPAPRRAFLRAWIGQPDSHGLAHVEGGALRGAGLIRRCRTGHKVGPLFADDPAIADNLYRALCANIGPDEPVYLDVPETNPAAMALAERHGMRNMFGTARMYTGPVPALPLPRIYGVTTFELG